MKSKMWTFGRMGVLVCASALAVASGTATAKPKADIEARPPVSYKIDPFPSTYRPFPGVPTVVRNVTIFDGEGNRIEKGEILFADGKIIELGQSLTVPEGATTIDGTGKWVTPGIIDIHSHMGVYPEPGTEGLADGNELTSPVTAEVWSEHSIWPQDPAFGTALTNGGVTTLHILPGSGNLFGGRSTTIKNVFGRTVQQMKFPGAPYGLKMACGSNPRGVYGAKGRMPSTRMGDVAVDRITWAKAAEYKRRWDKYAREGGEPPARDIQLDTLAGVLAGDILVQNHCYRADDMGNFIDMAKEFGYKITTFHHAVESYKLADVLAQEGICSAVFSEQVGFKLEAVDGIPEDLALLWKAGACVMAHSDSPDTVQMLNQEVAKMIAAGRRIGIDIPEATAWEFLSLNPAKALGISDHTGSLKPGKMADIVMWNGNPFSTYSRPEKVWIDGALLYDMNNLRLRPQSDFMLGKVGAGDPK